MASQDTDWAEEFVIWEVLDFHVWTDGEHRPIHSVIVELNRAREYYDWLGGLESHWCWDQARPMGMIDEGAIEVMFDDAQAAMLFKLTWGGR